MFEVRCVKKIENDLKYGRKHNVEIEDTVISGISATPKNNGYNGSIKF